MKKFILGLVILTVILAFAPGLRHYFFVTYVPGLSASSPAFDENPPANSPIPSPEKTEINDGKEIPAPGEAVNAPAEKGEGQEITQAGNPNPDLEPGQDNGKNIPDEIKHNKMIVSLNQIYSYEILTRDIKLLAETYPGLIEYKSLGTSRYNREIWAVKIGKGQPNVFINGSHHAREWSTTSISMYMLDRYANAYVNNENFEEYVTRDILDKISIWFVPMVNPDGVTLQQKGIEAFPEEARSELLAMNGGSYDFESWKANAEGVDLNRQYPADWESIVNNSPGPSSQNFKGDKPLNSFEAKTLANFTYEIDPEITLSYHDSGRILYWHFHNKPEVLTRDRALADEFSNLTGYTLVPPEPKPSGGGYKDWFIQEFGRPGFTAEIGQFANNRSIPASLLPAEWERNKKIGLFIANEGFKLWMEKQR